MRWTFPCSMLLAVTLFFSFSVTVTGGYATTQLTRSLTIEKVVDNQDSGLNLSPADFEITVIFTDNGVQTRETFSGSETPKTFNKEDGVQWRILERNLRDDVAVSSPTHSPTGCDFGQFSIGSPTTCTITNHISARGPTTETGTAEGTEGAATSPTSEQRTEIATTEIGTAVVPTEETGTVVLSSASPPTFIKVVSNCNLANPESCESWVQPYIFWNNEYRTLGSGFPGSERGRVIDIRPPETQLQYNIVATSEEDQVINRTYSEHCEGTIRAGENKTCIIDSNPSTFQTEVRVVTNVENACLPPTICDMVSAEHMHTQPYVLINNEYQPLGTGFPGSEKGRISEIFVGRGALVQYNIESILDLPMENMRTNITHSEGCEGIIKAGDNKTCTIRATLYTPQENSTTFDLN